MSDRLMEELLDAKNEICRMADDINNKEKEKLFCLVEFLDTEIREEISTIDIIQSEHRIIEHFECEIKRNKDFTYKVKVPEVKTINLEPGIKSMNCLDCNTVCHYPCKECSKKDDIIHCHAMKNGYCSKCGCHWKDHVLSPYRYEVHEIERERICEDLKKKYEEAKIKKQLHEQELERAKRECKKIYGKVFNILNKCKECVNNFQKKANGPITLHKIDDIERQIKEEEYKSNPGKEERLQSLHKLLRQHKLIDEICQGKENDILQRPINILKQCNIDTSFI